MAGNIITVKAEGLEKTGALLEVLSKTVDFKKKFRMTIEYDPELLNAKIRYEEISNDA